MNFEAVFKILIEQFQKYEIPFALIGGFALHAAGHSRATQDIDCLIDQKDAVKVKKILSSLGYEILHESEDVLNFASRLKELGKIDFLLAHRQYAKGMLKRADEIDVLNNAFKIKIVKPEDIIGLKIQSSSNDAERFHQDMADIEALLRLKKNQLDLELIRGYFKLFNREEEFDQILKRLNNAQ